MTTRGLPALRTARTYSPPGRGAPPRVTRLTILTDRLSAAGGASGGSCRGGVPPARGRRESRRGTPDWPLSGACAVGRGRPPPAHVGAVTLAGRTGDVTTDEQGLQGSAAVRGIELVETHFSDGREATGVQPVSAIPS